MYQKKLFLVNKNITKIIDKTLYSFSSLLYRVGIPKVYYDIKTQLGMVGIPILVYHRVCDLQSDVLTPGKMSVSVSAFSEQMKYLSTHYHSLSIDHLAEHLIMGKALPSKCVVITFDDGYLDNYINAYPILKRNNMQATFFISCGAVDSNIGLWPDQLVNMIQVASNGMKVIRAILNENGINLPVSLSKPDFIAHVLTILKSISTIRRYELLNQISKELDNYVHRETKLMMSWSQIREMALNGMEIGAHTINHPILSKTELNEVKKEIEESKRIIETQTGQLVNIFAYPNGRTEDFNDTIKDMVRDAGYKAACTTIFGLVKSGDDVYALRRIGIQTDDMSIFKARLCGFGGHRRLFAKLRKL